MIHKWKGTEREIKKMPQRKRANRGKKEAWPELEIELESWVKLERSKEHGVSTVKIILEARKIARRMQLSDFQGNPH